MKPTFHHPQHKQHKFLLVQIHPRNSEPDFDNVGDVTIRSNA